MLPLIVGILLCYGLFFLYDINQIRWKRTPLNVAFFVSVLLLLCITVRTCAEATDFSVLRLLPGGLLAAVFLGLLIHTLFFAVPMDVSYFEPVEDMRPACRTGVYALCRHPGVLWYIGFFFSLYLAFGGEQLLVLAVLGSALDILYAAFQDFWTFPQTFADYGEYKKETPFLVPSPSAILECMRTFERGGKK